MSVQNGIGAITDKGLAILAYIDSQPSPPDLAFQNFYISDIAIDSVGAVGKTLTDPSVDLGGGAGTTTKAQLATFLNSIGCSTEAKNFIGTVTKGDAGGGTALPILLTIPVGGIVNPLGNSVPIYAVFVTVESPIPADSSAEYVFWHGIVYYEDNSTSGTYTDDTNLPFSYYPGTNLLLRVNMEYSSGFPETISFTDNQIVEIEAHDELVSAHNTTHLRLDGGNSPGSNINWGGYKITNLDDASSSGDSVPHGQLTTISNSSNTYATATALQAAIDALPKVINHDITLNFTADISFETTTIYIQDFSGAGKLTLRGTSTPTLKNVVLASNTCELWLYEIRFQPASSGVSCVSASACNDLRIYGCYFKGGDHSAVIENNDGIIQSSFGSNVYLYSNTTIEKDASYIPKVGLRASSNSRITCAGWSQADDDAISGIVFYAESGGRINKPTITPGTISKNSIPRSSHTDSDYYEYAIDGGVILGRYGMAAGSSVSRTDTYEIGSTEIDYVSDLLHLVGPYIPENTTLEIEYDNGDSPFTTTKSVEISDFIGGGSISFSSSSGTTVINMDDVGTTFISGNAFNFRSVQPTITFSNLTINVTNASGNCIYASNVDKITFSGTTLTYPTADTTGIYATDVKRILATSLTTDGFEIVFNFNNVLDFYGSISNGGSQEPDYLFECSASNIIINSISAFKPSSGYFNINLLSNIKVVNPDVTFTDSWSSAQMQRYLDAIPKELTTDWDITINNPSTTYTLLNDIVFEDFYGKGNITITGNVTTPANCDFTGDYSFIFRNLSVETTLEGVQISSGDSSYILYLTDCSHYFQINDCVFDNTYSGGGASVYINNCSNVYLTDITYLGTAHYYHLHAYRSYVITYLVDAASEQAGAYGYLANYGSTIGAVSTTNVSGASGATSAQNASVINT